MAACPNCQVQSSPPALLAGKHVEGFYHADEFAVVDLGGSTVYTEIFQFAEPVTAK